LTSTIHFAQNPPVLEQIPARPFEHTEKLITEPGGFDDALSGTKLDVDFLSGFLIPARIERFQANTWTLDTGQIHVKARARAALPPGWGSVGFMLGAGHSAWHGVKIKSGALVCNPPGGDGPDGQVTPGFAWAAVGVPIKLWENCQAIGGAEVAGNGRPKIWHSQLPQAMFSILAQQLRDTCLLLKSALVRPELAPFADRAALEFVTNIATHGWEAIIADQHAALTSYNRSRLARRAEVWIRDRLAEPIRIPNICLALHVSRRELEYAFRSTFDTSPQNFLNKLRLNAIHRALLRADHTSSITRIAFEY
jgi:AraC family transcriptional regulator, ethanolamine operon transcriptional activator